METVYFRDEYVTLNQFLKLSGAVNTGGEGKELIISGQVYVNGEICISAIPMSAGCTIVSLK